MDEVIGEIETDKTSLPIVSPAAGVIEEFFVEDGGRVEKNDQLFKLKLGAGGGTSAKEAAPKAETPPQKEEEPAAPPPPKQETPKSSVSGPAPTQAPKSIQISILHFNKLSQFDPLTTGIH